MKWLAIAGLVTGAAFGVAVAWAIGMDARRVSGQPDWHER